MEVLSHWQDITTDMVCTDIVAHELLHSQLKTVLDQRIAILYITQLYTEPLFDFALLH